MIDFLSYLPFKQKATVSGWISTNAPCCQHRGHSRDQRGRGGFKPIQDGGFSYNCFNCGFTASVVPGRILGFKARCLLGWLGVEINEIERINLESMRYRSIHGLLQDQQLQRRQLIEFEETDLPPGLELIDSNNPKHTRYIDYLQRRCIDHTAYPYMVSPTAPARNKNRIIIPFTHNSQVVGNTMRFLDDRVPKYLNDIQPGYVFGFDLQKDNWTTAIVTEGVFDAVSINGLAVLHNNINAEQAQLINGLERDIIVVPDQDRAGMTLVDRAVELGWAVSIPEWPQGVKDINDAVINLGQLGALLTIIEAKETSRIKIEMRKKRMIKQMEKINA